MINPAILNFLAGIFATLGTVTVGYFTFRGTKVRTKSESRIAEIDRANEQLVALTQERTKLLEYYEKQLEKSNKIIESQTQQLEIYKKQTELFQEQRELFQEQIMKLERTIQEVTHERDELSALLKKVRRE
ncbi:hypothetical protein ACYRFS_12320 [Listeria kieliensis]